MGSIFFRACGPNVGFLLLATHILLEYVGTYYYNIKTNTDGPEDEEKEDVTRAESVHQKRVSRERTEHINDNS